MGKVFRAMLKFHMYDAGLWARAARYETEEADKAENARKLLLEGLRFNKESEELWREVI